MVDVKRNRYRVDARLKADLPALFLSVEFEMDRGPAAVFAEKLGRGIQSAFSRRVLLFRADIVQARIVHSSEIDLAVNAADHETDSPVPARMTLHFADQIHVRDAVVSVDSEVERLFQRLLRGFDDRRMNDNFNSVFPLFQKRLDVGSDPPEHIVRTPRGFAVDPDVGKRVERVDVEIDGVFCEQIRSNLKIPAVSPVEVTNPLDILFVFSEIGIGNEFVPEQSGVVVSGNVRLDGSEIFSVTGEGPFPCEIDCLHLILPGW